MTDRKSRRPVRDPKAQGPSDPEENWIDVHDDALMIELGIRPKHLVPRDPNVWTKTPKEKKQLAAMRCAHKGRMHRGLKKPVSIPVKDKLIIQLKKNKRYPHTTYSIKCYQHQIPSILSRYYTYNKYNGEIRNVVAKYTFNGRTYGPNELPYWPV